MNMETPSWWRYWTWPELLAFLLDHDLVIQGDPDDAFSIVATGRGQELFAFLIAMLRTGGTEDMQLVALAAEAEAQRLVDGEAAQ